MRLCSSRRCSLAPETWRDVARRLGFAARRRADRQRRSPLRGTLSGKAAAALLDQAFGRASEPLALIAPPPRRRGSLRQPLEPSRHGRGDCHGDLTRLTVSDLAPALERDGSEPAPAAPGHLAPDLTARDADGSTSASRRRRSPAASRARRSQARAHSRDHRLRPSCRRSSLAVTAAALSAAAGRRSLLLPMHGRQRVRVAAALHRRWPQATAGSRRVRRLSSVASHIPERAETPRSAATGDGGLAGTGRNAARHSLLLHRAEPLGHSAGARRPARRALARHVSSG